jgi:hypothetical protein
MIVVTAIFQCIILVARTGQSDDDVQSNGGPISGGEHTFSTLEYTKMMLEAYAGQAVDRGSK